MQKYILFFLLIFCATWTMANDSIMVAKDTIGEVVVTGTRSQTEVKHLSQSVSVINQQVIQQTQQATLMPILSEQIPGLFVTARGVMGYGVSGGASGSISIRGLSGGSGQMMVLIDGHPQYMGIMGHPIADSYQSFLAEKIEVLRGSASVLYGSNAMGGVVNIVTRKMQQEGVKTHIRAGYGAYNTFESEVSNQVRKNKFHSVVTLSYNRTDGHRDNMEFQQYGGYAKLGYDISDHWSVSADVNVTHFDASQPGTVSTPLEDADQSITRGVTSLMLENNYQRTSGTISAFYNFGHHYINDGYTPNKTEPKLYRFDSRDFMTGISAYQSTQFWQGSRLTIGADFFAFGGKASNKFVEGPRDGQSTQLIDTTVYESAGYIDFRQHLGEFITLNAGLRYDYHSMVGSAWIPQGGLAVHLPHSIELKASANKGYRNPTLKDMFLFPPQNPNLKPESLWNYELAVSQNLLQGKLFYALNVFYIDGKNIILSLPNPNGAGMLNQNSGKIENSGIEAQIRGKINTAWTLEGNYSYLHMKNPVVAAPEHKLYVGAVFTEGRWSVSSGLQYIHDLYIATNPVKKDHFLLWNIRGSMQVTKWLNFWMRGENLLAQKYEINAGYPMPLATVVGGINIHF